MNDDNVLTLYYWFLVERMNIWINRTSIHAKWYGYGKGNMHDNAEILTHSFPFLRPFLFKYIVERR